MPFELDPRRTLGALWLGPGDPTMRVVGQTISRATRTPAGAAAMRLTFGAHGEVVVDAWGDGAEAAIDGLPDLLGAADDPAALAPRHALVGELARRMPGLRMTRSRAVFGALMTAIIGQKVTGDEARRSQRALIHQLGEPAPGPLGLTLPPAPEAIAARPYWAFHELGVERRRADTLRRAAAAARPLEACIDLGVAVARRRLATIAGVGAWTAAETVRVAFGDPDAVSIGDYHVPNLVSWALAGEPRGTDERMLELLSPYAGQRARVVLLLELSGLRPPRYGPRMAARHIAAI